MILFILFIVFIPLVLISISAKESSDNYNFRKLGYGYKKLFNLKKSEIRAINNSAKDLQYNVAYIDFCVQEIISLYINVIRELSTLNRWDEMLNKNLLNYCSAVIRQEYSFKPPSETAMLEIRRQLSNDVLALVTKKRILITPLTEENEKQLFENDSDRWKPKYSLFEEEYTDPVNFYNNICKLAEFNKERIMVSRDIFYKGHLFTANKDKCVSLKLYVHYIGVKSTSNTFKYKPINQKNTKKLLSLPNDEKEFEQIIKQFHKKGDIAVALKLVEEFCAPKRKKIKLNVTAIQDAGDKHTKVAKLLDEYLTEEEIPEQTPDLQPQIKIQQAVSQTADDNRKELFKLFISNNYRLSQQQVSVFAQQRGLFKDQFIESINDFYYEELDDLLIEEELDHLLLNQDYFNEISY